MPSSTFQNFEKRLIVDVDRIIASHTYLSPRTPGKRGLGHLTRSGVLMLCAAWEVYLEGLLLESCKKLSGVPDPKKLPESVQKELVKHVSKYKHDLKPLELAGEGWREVYMNHAEECAKSLNTPKSSRVDELYKQLIGVDTLSGEWSCGAQKIDGFVTTRGEIAHKGSESRYVKIAKLQEYKVLVQSTVLETDNFMTGFLKENLGKKRQPWKKTKR